MAWACARIHQRFELPKLEWILHNMAKLLSQHPKKTSSFRPDLLCHFPWWSASKDSVGSLRRQRRNFRTCLQDRVLKQPQCSALEDFAATQPALGAVLVRFVWLASLEATRCQHRFLSSMNRTYETLWVCLRVPVRSLSHHLPGAPRCEALEGCLQACLPL